MAQFHRHPTGPHAQYLFSKAPAPLCTNYLILISDSFFCVSGYNDRKNT